jgi:zinc transport system permease protein
MLCTICFSSLVSYLRFYTRNLAPELLISLVGLPILATGLIIIYHTGQSASVIHQFFLGNLFSISWNELVWITLLMAVVLLLLWRYWHVWILISLQEELAFIRHIPVRFMQWLLYNILALSCIFSMQLVGVLLVSGLMLLPAAIARLWSKKPSQMVYGAMFIGLFGSLLGLWASYKIDIPTNPLIIIILTILFVISAFLQIIQRYYHYKSTNFLQKP